MERLILVALILSFSACATPLKDEGVSSELGVEKSQQEKIEPNEACVEDCRKMFEKGELRKGMTVEECIKVLCE